LAYVVVLSGLGRLHRTHKLKKQQHMSFGLEIEELLAITPDIANNPRQGGR